MNATSWEYICRKKQRLYKKHIWTNMDKYMEKNMWTKVLIEISKNTERNIMERTKSLTAGEGR